MATGIWIRRSQLGFTLLEVMIVLVLIGIITGFAVLSARGSGADDRAATEARRLAALMELTHQEAVLRSEQRGIWFSETGYVILTLDGEGEWHPVEDSGLLKSHELPSGLNLRLQVEGRPVKLAKDQEPIEPQVLLLSNGEATDFSLTLSGRDVRGYVLSGDLTGRLELHPTL